MDSEPLPLAEALEGDPGADETSYLATMPGVIGVRDTRELGDIAGRLAGIGRASHTPFGDHIARLGTLASEIAAEARRRLAEDRLPPTVGTADQVARRAEG